MAAILLFALVTVETGGLYLLRVVRGDAVSTPFQLSFARAGHAHAGVLLILSLVGLLYADAVGLNGPLGTIARSGVPVAALLMSAGFFLSSLGEGRQEPNRFIVMVYVGGVCWRPGSSPSASASCALPDGRLSGPTSDDGGRCGLTAS
ncbi:MAG: hypothetical protein WEB03_01625 [Nitriliruptor sp.]|uniref:hypothetical protein n=1 Tax=Nitriliruptor sp. TaxID=2448056 RepID=UPI0034A062EE